MEVYNEENDEYYIYCDVCKMFCIKRFYDNHSNSINHTNNPIKLQKIQTNHFF